MNSSGPCCSSLFSSFVFQDIRNARPPERRGVYVIRVKRMGTPTEEIVRQVEQLVQGLGWSMVGDKVLNRIRRLEKVHHCSTIYIGSAGTRAESRNTLRGRYEEFSGRHTVMYPLWALLFFGWELEYGWREEASPDVAEGHLKEVYRRNHQGKLPALVHR